MRVRAAAEIEAEKHARDRATSVREVADLALLAAGRVVGETMTDERQRRLVEEFLAERPASDRRRLEATDGHDATRPRAATRRPPSRSPSVTARSRRGARELDAAGRSSRDERSRARAREPGRRRSRQRPDGRHAIFGEIASRPGPNLIGLMLRRGRIEQLPRVAAEFRRLDDAPPGHHPRHRHQRRAADRRTRSGPSPRGSSSSPAVASTSTTRSIPSLLGGLVVRVGDRLIDGSVRGRLERLRNQLVSGAL